MNHSSLWCFFCGECDYPVGWLTGEHRWQIYFLPLKQRCQSTEGNSECRCNQCKLPSASCCFILLGTFERRAGWCQLINAEKLVRGSLYTGYWRQTAPSLQSWKGLPVKKEHGSVVDHVWLALMLWIALSAFTLFLDWLSCYPTSFCYGVPGPSEIYVWKGVMFLYGLWLDDREKEVA